MDIQKLFTAMIIKRFKMKFIEHLKDSLEESCKIRPFTRNDNGDVICFQCGRVAKEHCNTPAGLREVEISGLCEECYDKLFEEEEE